MPSLTLKFQYKKWQGKPFNFRARGCWYFWSTGVSVSFFGEVFIAPLSTLFFHSLPFLGLNFLIFISSMISNCGSQKLKIQKKIFILFFMACLPAYIFSTNRLLLCVKTNKRVLCTLFPGQNHVSQHVNIFRHKQKKEEEKLKR